MGKREKTQKADKHADAAATALAKTYGKNTEKIYCIDCGTDITHTGYAFVCDGCRLQL